MPHSKVVVPDYVLADILTCFMFGRTNFQGSKEIRDPEGNLYTTQPRVIKLRRTIIRMCHESDSKRLMNLARAMETVWSDE